MKEEWLFPGAMAPVDVETTAALVAEIKRLIDVVGGMALAQPEQEPVAHLWQHGETGRTRVIFPDSITDCDASWFFVGPLVLGIINPPQRTWVGSGDLEDSNAYQTAPTALKENT